MYKLWHLLFGWDYIHWEVPSVPTFGIARVFMLPDGTAVYWKYKNIKVLCIIDDRKDVKWLTCNPSKYGL